MHILRTISKAGSYRRSIRFAHSQKSSYYNLEVEHAHVLFRYFTLVLEGVGDDIPDVVI